MDLNSRPVEVQVGMRPTTPVHIPDDAPGMTPKFVPMLEMLVRHTDRLLEHLRASENASFALRNGPITSRTMNAEVFSTVGRIVDDTL